MNIICTQCKGNKKHRGIGSMTVTCDMCNGKGYIYKQEEDDKPQVLESQKKYARKKWRNENGG